MQWPPEIAPTINAHFGNKQGLENQHINGGGECLPLVSKCLITKNRMDAETETLIPTTGGHFNSDPVLQPAYGIPGNWIGRKPENGGNATEPMYDIAPCLTKADQHGVAQPIAYNIAPGKGALKDDIHVTDADATKTLDASGSNPAMHQGGAAIVQPIAFSRNDDGRDATHDLAPTMRVAGNAGGMLGIATSMAVRRLSPKECERLQGFPDSYTDIKSKNKPTPDGPRYKALGNSMAVPVMAWIGARIQQYEDMQ
jgi:DNA (cytosine-5)-methyltransferase 1